MERFTVSNARLVAQVLAVRFVDAVSAGACLRRPRRRPGAAPETYKKEFLMDVLFGRPIVAHVLHVLVAEEPWHKLRDDVPQPVIHRLVLGRACHTLHRLDARQVDAR